MNPRLLYACLSFIFVALAVCCGAQTNTLAWTMQESGTTASLRGIASVDGKIAWASGSGGTVLRTTDGGGHWTRCAVPYAEKDGATLDFRGVQAFDADTAVVMSAGSGELSRLYATFDGCKSWTMLLKNPDAKTAASPDAGQEGFFDSFFADWSEGTTKPNWVGSIVGDPVRGRFVLLDTVDSGRTWTAREGSNSNSGSGLGAGSNSGQSGLELKGASLGGFAASNSLFPADQDGRHDAHIFATGGKSGGYVWIENTASPGAHTWTAVKAPMAEGADSTGIFSIAAKTESVPYRNSVTEQTTLLAVGGDYQKPAEMSGTAAWSTDHGLHWKAAERPPHGFRSAVEWSPERSAWIAVGTNGSDLSRDDGKTWAAMDDAQAPGGNWNALSLPFVVGPKGRIARLAAAK
jgi:photosystem II stability/assembly factor-like uncharacterized protein